MNLFRVVVGKLLMSTLSRGVIERAARISESWCLRSRELRSMRCPPNAVSGSASRLSVAGAYECPANDAPNIGTERQITSRGTSGECKAKS